MYKQHTNGTHRQWDEALEGIRQGNAPQVNPAMDQEVLQAAQALVEGLVPLRQVPIGAQGRVWRQVQMRMIAPSRTTLHLDPPGLRIGWAALALVIFLPVAVLVYSTLSDLYQADAGLNFIEQENLGQRLDLVQTTDGFTLTLQRLHVDGNRVTVGGHIAGPALMDTISPWPRLTDKTGRVYAMSELHMTSVRDQARAFVASFDATAMEAVPETLTMVVEVLEHEPTADPLQEVESRSLAEPVTFDLDVTASAEWRVVEVHQTVQQNGVELTLEQVRISRTSAYAVICPNVPDRESVTWGSHATLATGAGLADRLLQSDTTMTGITPKACHTARFFAPHYYERSGEWTLTVAELTAFGANTPEDEQSITGSWVFRFTVPQP